MSSDLGANQTRKFRYDAFISYSHKADAPLAKALESHLEQFAKPWYRFRAANVFRDETSLTATPHLWPTIVANLNSSAYLIVLGSTTSAESKWVRKEICYWITNGLCDDQDQLQPSQIHADRVERVFLVLTEGDIVWDDSNKDFDWGKTNALSKKVLTKVFTNEPLWIDLRWTRTTQKKLDRANEAFMDVIARLSSPIRKLDIETLIGTDFREYRRTINLFRRLSIGLAILLLAVLAVAWFAFDQWNGAEQRLAEIRLQNGRRAIISDKEIDTGLLWFAETLLTSGTRTESERKAASVLLAGWSRSLPIHSLPHQSAIRQVLWSPDSRYVVTASGNQACTWDAFTGTFHGATPPLKGELSAILYRSRGLLLATSSSDEFEHTGQAYHWNMENGQNLELTKGKEYSEINSLVFSPDGKFIALASYKGTQLFDALTGIPVGPVLTQTNEVFKVVFSPNGKTLVTGSRGLRGESEGEFCIWDAHNKKQCGEPFPYEEELTAIAFTRDSNKFAIGCNDGKVNLFDSTSGKVLGSPLDCEQSITSLSFSSDGQLLASASTDGVVRLWDVSKRRMLKMLTHQSSSNNISFSPTSRILASVHEEKTVLLWHVDTGLETRLPFQHRSGVSSMSFSPDGRSLATASSDGICRLWNVSYTLVAASLKHEKTVRTLCYHGNSSIIASGCDDGNICLWDTTKSNLKSMLIRDKSAVIALRFSSDGRTLHTASSNKIHSWDWEAGAYLKDLQFRFSAEEVVISLDGRLVAAAEMDVPQGGFEPPTGNVEVWDVFSSKTLYQCSNKSRISSMTFGRDSNSFETHRSNGTRRFVSLKNGVAQEILVPSRTQEHELNKATNKPWRQPILRDEAVKKIDITSDCKTIAMVNKNTVQLWDDYSHCTCCEPIQVSSAIITIAFRPDDRVLAIAHGTQVSLVTIPILTTNKFSLVKLSVEVRTASMVDNGVIRSLSRSEWLDRKSILTKLGGDCLSHPLSENEK